MTQLGGEVNNLSTAVQTLQNAPSIIGDCGSIVLTCPRTTDTATYQVILPTDWSAFYARGYNPNGSPFHMTTFVGGNFLLLGVNPVGLSWIRPTTSVSETATFEIDASVSFIPSLNMAVRVGVGIYAGQFDRIPMFDLGLNEREYRISTAVVTWSVKMIITLPLKKDGIFANYVAFTVDSTTTTGDFNLQFIYGVGENFANQHQLIVKRIQ